MVDVASQIETHITWAQRNVLENEHDITAFFNIIQSGGIKWYLKDLYGFDGGGGELHRVQDLWNDG